MCRTCFFFCRSSQSSSYIRWKQVSSPGTMWGTSFSVLNWWWKWLVSVPSGEFSVRLCATAGLWEHVWPIQAEGPAEPVWKTTVLKNFLVESILVWYCDVCVVFMLCCVVLYCVASLVYVVRLKPIFSLWFLERHKHKRFLHLRFNFSWQLRFWSWVFICSDIALQGVWGHKGCREHRRQLDRPGAPILTRNRGYG